MSSAKDRNEHKRNKQRTKNKQKYGSENSQNTKASKVAQKPTECVSTSRSQ